jgi:hemolysin-activating ACP:hemolysin acyltransferase
VTWALVSDEIHAVLQNTRKELEPDEWRSGDNLWITEAIIRPDVDAMVFTDLTQAVFPNKIGHMWTSTDGTTWAVETYYGANRQGDAAAARRG